MAGTLTIGRQQMSDKVRSDAQDDFGLRRNRGGSAHSSFRGLLSVYSRYGLHARLVAFATFCTRGFSSFVASTAVLIATGWNEQVPGGFNSRCGPSPFHGAPGFRTYQEVVSFRHGLFPESRVNVREL